MHGRYKNVYVGDTPARLVSHDSTPFLRRWHGHTHAHTPHTLTHRRRLKKWRKMLGSSLSDWKEFVRSKPEVVQRRVRKGIPDSLRGYSWQVLSGGRELRLRNAGVYEQLIFFETSAADLDIMKDISRTFPTHVYYQQRNGPGQRSLYNVLKAYSIYDRDVGYVQGMVGAVQAPPQLETTR